MKFEIMGQYSQHFFMSCCFEGIYNRICALVLIVLTFLVIRDIMEKLYTYQVAIIAYQKTQQITLPVFTSQFSQNRDKCRHQYGECVDIPGGYTCRCKEGYYGDGIKSCKLANECKQGLHNCHKTLATCINTQKSFDCRCINGFEGNGRSCKDIDECDSGKHDCGKIDNAFCVNTNGSFRCDCKSGFTRNGKDCKNINECTTGTHECVQYAVCTDNIGSYSCRCKEGFGGDAKRKCRRKLCLALAYLE